MISDAAISHQCVINHIVIISDVEIENLCAIDAKQIHSFVTIPVVHGHLEGKGLAFAQSLGIKIAHRVRVGPTEISVIIRTVKAAAKTKGLTAGV